MSMIWTHGQRGQARMAPTDFELGQQARRTLLDFYGSTRTSGTARDKTGVAIVRSRYPKTRGLLSDAELVALLREVQSGTCTWCSYQMTSGGPAPAPTDALRGLWGSQCSRCKVLFEAREIVERERGLMAAGYGRYQRPAPTGTIRVDRRPRPVTAAAGPQPSVRDLINQARERQRVREATR